MIETLAREWVKWLPNHVVIFPLNRTVCKAVDMKWGSGDFLFSIYPYYLWLSPAHLRSGLERHRLRRHIWGLDMGNHECRQPSYGKKIFWDSLEQVRKNSLHRNQVPLILYNHGNFQNSGDSFTQITSYSGWWNPSFSSVYHEWDPTFKLPSCSDWCRIEKWAHDLRRSSQTESQDLLPGKSFSFLWVLSLKGYRLNHCIHVATMRTELGWEQANTLISQFLGIRVPLSFFLPCLNAASQSFKWVSIWKLQIRGPQDLVWGFF